MNDSNGNGLAGKILRVNLTTGEMTTEDTIKYAARFIGGRSVNSFILFNEVSPSTLWSDPDNLLIFGAGRLVGTLAPGACRLSIDTKSVFSNGKGSANVGGDFAAEMKYTGFDHIVITGKAERPVYLWLSDGRAELRPADFLWGKSTYQTEEILQREVQDKRVKIASIGPSGENRVRGSAVIVDCAKAAGGSGVGCVMGDKRLKAVVARGQIPIKVAQPEKFLAAVEKSLGKIMASPRTKLHRQGNIISSMFPESPLWVTAVTRNGQDDFWPLGKRIKLAGNDLGTPRYKKSMSGCISCPTGCMPYYEIHDGIYKGTCGTGYWINSALYSVRMDVCDAAASLKFHLLTNQLGLDSDFAAVVCSWAFECYEKGLITPRDTDGLDLVWGNGEAMVELERRIAYREGIGNLLADGVKEASKNLGRGSQKYAIYSKGQDSVDPYRIMKGFGLGVATSPVGGRHLRGAVTSQAVSGPQHIFFAPDKYINQPEVVFWQANAKEIEDMTGVCNYMGTWTGAHILDMTDYAELVRTAAGIDIDEHYLMLVGRQGYNLEKAFNTLHAGFTRQDDLPPARYMEEEVKSGKFVGFKCDPEEWVALLDRFYELQGWDKETSWQTRECLAELRLEDVSQKLKKFGKLIE